MSQQVKSGLSVNDRAIGDPQCVRHELFAMLRIWMVDGESV
jgi:hypothetical protein